MTGEIARSLPFWTPPLAPDGAGAVSWVHIGDLHVTRARDESDLRLASVVRDLEARFAGTVAFAFLPGDIANEGRLAQYEVVRGRLSALTIPWFAVVGDHDVHEGTLAHVQRTMAPRAHHAFTVGRLRGIALNAFDGDDPRAFEIGHEQLSWLDDELAAARRRDLSPVVFLHCYPSDLQRGGEKLSALLRAHEVRLVEMGHTHYNELANDGHTLYIATRSTGQIEEGPLGFSVTTVDGDHVSWRFVTLGERLTVVITSPTDERLVRDDAPGIDGGPSTLRVRAKVWSDAPLEHASVTATSSLGSARLVRVGESHVFEGLVPFDPDAGDPAHGEITVVANEARGTEAQDLIRVPLAGRPRPTRHARDQDNAIAAWPEHGLLATQLGPNKNGRDW